MRDLKLFLLLVAAMLAIAACGGGAVNNSGANNAATNKSANTATTNAAPIASNANSSTTGQIDGKQLYADSCMICHKDTGKGGPVTIEGKKLKPADLTSDKMKKHTDDDVAKDIREGSPDDGMPAFKDKLKPEEIKAIVGYIRSLQ